MRTRSLGPGPSNLIEGTDLYGYYGKHTGIVTANDLIKLASINEGVTKNDSDNNPNEGITWLKFSHNYKTLFVADRTIHYGVSWNHLNEKNLVHGKVVDIEGQKYLLRLLQGSNINPTISGGGANSNDEWDSLIATFTPNTEDSHWSTDDPVNTQGAFSICQEILGLDIMKCISRGGEEIGDIAGVLRDSADINFGYRPVLEVL